MCGIAIHCEGIEGPRRAWLAGALVAVHRARPGASCICGPRGTHRAVSRSVVAAGVAQHKCRGLLAVVGGRAWRRGDSERCWPTRAGEQGTPLRPSCAHTAAQHVAQADQPRAWLRSAFAQFRSRSVQWHRAVRGCPLSSALGRMSPRTFLRLSLAVPLLVPIFAFVSGSTSGVAFVLIMSLAFGGVPYALTAIVLWRLLGHCNTVRSYVRTALMAPALFAPLQAIAWLAWELHEAKEYVVPHNATYNSAYSSVALASYGLAIGYAYVLFVLCAFFAAIRLKLIAPPPSASVENAA